jgi:hypothetical protein
MPDHGHIWYSLMVGVCPSDGMARSICDCPQCSADDDEDLAIFEWATRREVPNA